MLACLALLAAAAAQPTELSSNDTSVTAGVGMAPGMSRLLHGHLGVQHRFTPNAGIYGLVESYSTLSVRPGLQGRAFLPLSDRARLVAGAGASVWFGLMEGEQRYQAFMPELEAGIQGEAGPLALAADFTPALAIREKVELWPMVRVSIGAAF